MAKNKKSKTPPVAKRPNIRSTSVLSDTSVELQYLSDEDINADDEPQPSTSARRTTFRMPTPNQVDSGRTRRSNSTSTSSSSETRDTSKRNSDAFLTTPISAKKSNTNTISWVLDHFAKISENKCKCNNCQVVHVVSGTGTMSRHMHSKHSTKIPKPLQSTIDNNGKVVKPYKFDPEEAHRAFIEFVVTNNHAFTTGEEAAFQRFINKLQPLYKTLGGTSVKNRVMKTYVTMRHLVVQKLNHYKVALTTDMWTSSNNLAFMGITVSFLDEKFNPSDIIIGFQHVPGEHSGVNLANTFYETIQSYNLQEKLLAITTDNASSNETFIDQIVKLTEKNANPFNRDKWIRCFAHVLNLCVKCALECMAELIDKLRNLVTSIRASPKRIQKFKKILMDLNFSNSNLQYEEEEVLLSTLNGVVIMGDLLPILDVQTRWSSTYYFLKRSLRLENAINEIAKDPDLRENELQPEEWAIVKEVFEFLKSFAIITTYIETTKYPTLSLVVPMYNKLLDLLEKVSTDRRKHSLIQKGAQAGLKKLSSYYDKSSPLVMTAAFMDPRCKMNYFLVNGWNVGAELTNSYSSLDEDLISTRVKPAIAHVWSSYSSMPLPSESSQNNPLGINLNEGNQTVKRKPSQFDQSFIADILSGSSNSVVHTKDELREYEAEELEPSNCDPDGILLYWAQRSRKWPRLSSMARDILTIPATSASSERAFSAGKDVFGISRMSLNPETVEALLCLRSWYRAGLLEDMNVDAFICEIENVSADNIDDAIDEELTYAHMQCNSLFEY